MATAAYIGHDRRHADRWHISSIHNGWAPDYRWDLSSDGGQPPAMFSHNLYIDRMTRPTSPSATTLRCRARPTGLICAAVRFVEDSLFLDNNAAVDFLGGNYEGARPDRQLHSLFTDNVITSGAHKEINGFIGGLTIGVGKRRLRYNPD